VNYANDAAAAAVVVRAIKEQGNGDATAVQADVSTLDGGKHLLQEAIRIYGKLDILVLSAGIMGSKPLEEIDEAFFDKHMQINVKVPLFLAKAALEYLPARELHLLVSLIRSPKHFFQLGDGSFSVRQVSQAQLVRVSSNNSNRHPYPFHHPLPTAVLPNALCYVASKGAIEQISRVLAKDIGRKGITVNTFSPGPVDTTLFREGKPPHVIDAIAGQNPNNRIGLPEDIGPSVAFLASPAAQWINGQNLRVNGVSAAMFDHMLFSTDYVYLSRASLSDT
jgi:3-oxoacyl-[acyl-carrier protein] reductase